jgi:hypothetical protein
MAGDPSLLFIIGGGDEADRIVQTGSQIVATGTTDLDKLVEREPYHRLHVTRNIFRKGRIPEFDSYRVLVNLITEPEKNVRVLENLRKLLRGARGRVVNRPEMVLRSTRDQVARRLEGIPGLIVPKVIRLQGGKPAIAMRALERAGVDPPIIVRQIGTHSGKILGRFDTLAEAVAALETGEHLATQFIDFQSGDGLYRKYRVFFIGPHFILRHMLVSDEWNVHAKDRVRFMAERPELVAEERALFEHEEFFPASVAQVLAAIRERMGLDFFGMDFGVTPDGKVVLFEANATMSFFPFSPDPQFDYLKRCFAPAQAAFRELLGLPAQAAPAIHLRLESA